jgi:hypothetical protein
MRKRSNLSNHYDLLHGTETKDHALVPCGWINAETRPRLEERPLLEIERHDPPIKTWVLVYRSIESSGTLEQRDTWLTCRIDRGDPGRICSMISTEGQIYKWSGDCGYVITPRYADPAVTSGVRMKYHEAMRKFGKA